MEKLKSHFVFSKNQRNGIFSLIVLIVVFKFVYHFMDVPKDAIEIDATEVEKFQNEIDSLKAIQVANSKPKLYPFNPNFITDHKGYTLGMSNEEIDRLLRYRREDKWINSVAHFQEVTQVSDSLLTVISPYFKFPDWVTNPKQKSEWANDSKFNSFKPSTSKTYAQKIDLNKATAEELTKVNGIGAALSDRIIKYRSKFSGGFLSDIQLQDIYGLTPEVIERLTNDFTVKTPRPFQKLNLNTATRDELVTVQYLDYDSAHYIIEYRTLHEGFKSLDELAKVKNFPALKIEIIKLYLTLN